MSQPSATLTLNANMLRNLEDYQTRLKTPSQLQSYSAKLQFLTDLVEDNWETLPDSTRKAIRVYAYSLMDRKPTFWGHVKSLLFLYRVWTSKEVLADFLSALVRLDNVVLDLIEKEHSTYFATLNRAIGEVESNLLDSQPMTTDELREWMQSI